jgi:hypothetical protein
MAPFELLAPIVSWVFGNPEIPAALGVAEGQLIATNVCHPKFSQSLWEGLTPFEGFTSWGTTQELAGSTPASARPVFSLIWVVPVALVADFLLQAIFRAASAISSTVPSVTHLDVASFLIRPFAVAVLFKKNRHSV